MLLYAAERRRQASAQADLVDAVAMGYGGIKSKEGNKAMQSYVEALRKG